MGLIQSREIPSHCCGAPSLLPAMARSLRAHQGTVPDPPFSFPEARPLLEKAPLSQSRELQWAQAALCLAVSNRPACSPLPARCPLGGTVGSHGQPWLMVGDANQRAVPVGARSGVPCCRGALGPPGCQRGRVSLFYAMGNSDGPSGCLLPPGRRKGVCPAGWQRRGEVGEVRIGPGLT